MGYYTRFRLKLHEASTEQRNRVSNFMDSDGVMPGDEDSSFTSTEREVIAPAWYNELDECKWYSHEEDMRDFSKKFPDVIFLLEGEGERQGDAWRKFFKNGKLQVCEAVVTFADFSPSKLR